MTTRMVTADGSSAGVGVEGTGSLDHPGRVIVAGPQDREALAAMFARAFQDDPAFAYIFPDPAVRARRLPKLFRLLFDSDRRAGVGLMTADAAAGTLWRAPGRAAVGRAELLAHAAPTIAALRGGLVRALRVADAIDRHLPAGHFWYLHMAGCDRDRQGRGLGSAVIAAGLAMADGQRVYLETASERNLALYARFGFAITSEWRVGGGGPRFWSMLRT